MPCRSLLGVRKWPSANEHGTSLCIPLHLSTSLCISLHPSASLYIPLHLSTSLCIPIPIPILERRAAIPSRRLPSFMHAARDKRSTSHHHRCA
jgi:hypothetical protein